MEQRNRMSLMIAMLLVGSTSAAAQTVCDAMDTYGKREACEIGYSAGFSAATPGTDGLIISGLRRSPNGGVVVVPKSSPGTEGFEIIGVAGTSGEELGEYEVWQDMFEGLTVSPSMKAAIDLALDGKSSEGYTGSAFRLMVEDGEVSVIEALRDGAWTSSPGGLNAPAWVLETVIE